MKHFRSKATYRDKYWIVQFEQLSNLTGIRFVITAITAAANRGGGSGSSVWKIKGEREDQQGE